uniref:Uncharacterized protein n=1 Tax=Trichobilharzia regenti TaxID=157069 RepID=A0AA85KGW7_TRIRE|nr:unnamed protein product [Trichobilharzia regenti]
MNLWMDEMLRALTNNKRVVLFQHQEQSYSLLNRIRVLEDEIKELVQYKSNHEEQQVNFESQLNDKTCQAQAFEEKFVKLKEIYAKLREEHVVLLRNYGNVQQTLQQETEKNKDLEKALEVSLFYFIFLLFQFYFSSCY